jgi:hypothetical protein
VTVNADSQSRPGLARRALVWPVVALLVAVAVWLASDHGLHPHDHSKDDEWRAVGALKSINASQTLFRENDKEGDELLDYGSLAELSSATLIDPVLGSGTKEGYVFQVRPSPTTGEFLWFATANPAGPATRGDKSYCTNHEGVIFYTTGRTLSLDDGGLECTIPAGLLPVGR